MATIFYIKAGMLIRRARTHLTFCAFSYVIFPATFLFFGCSILPLDWARPDMPKDGAFSKAELSLRTAAEARADELAPMDLQRAKEKLENARRAMAAGKDTEARRLAEAADVEAELAEAKAEAEIMRLAADYIRRRGDVLRQELEGDAKRGSATETSRGR